MAAPVSRPEPKFDWFIPIDGDGIRLGTRQAERPPTFEYLRDVVQTAERLGYYSLLIPTRFVNGLFDEGAPLVETWTMATALAAVTSRIRFLIAVRPGFIAAGLFAKMVATLDQISHGRVDINIVPGGIANDFERLGVDIDPSDVSWPQGPERGRRQWPHGPSGHARHQPGARVLSAHRRQARRAERIQRSDAVLSGRLAGL